MEEIEQAAFLLHARPYQENKVLAEFLTKEQGKVSAIAYVGSSLKSNKKALLQPFSPLKILLKGRSNLKTLSRIEPDKKSYLLSGNYLYSGFYLNELQVRLLGEHISYPELFAHYQQSLAHLADKVAIEAVLRNFENVLLEELGLTIDYSPVFESDSLYFNYLYEQGFTPACNSTSHLRFEKSHLKSIAEKIYSGSTLIEPPMLSNAVMHTFKLLMRQIINHLLGGKPLNSRKLFK
jgi:DNA repair protein RecO (recombination protein O)